MLRSTSRFARKYSFEFGLCNCSVRPILHLYSPSHISSYKLAVVQHLSLKHSGQLSAKSPARPDLSLQV
ncbi:hypothetical protein NPIL_295661 [Nephila pilipes]|uniref:Uncharacterized protein n=1 Tax=Nephila pilipes TaxID=299642 RepID=A0A8X6R7B3_NEPPI|nr:hypothetical protein NPIL_295661 [Nephila pilipes]